MKKFFLILLLILIVLLAIITFNTLQFTSKQLSSTGKRIIYPVDTVALKHLSTAISIPTISFDDKINSDNDTSFVQLISFLHQTYPLVFEKLDDTLIDGKSLLIHWRSTDPKSKPVIVYAHMDVVPVDTNAWKRAPFSGYISTDSIYGRGAIDDKGSVISIMESVQQLMSTGFNPTRDIFIAFGCDEEAGGENGAKKIADYLLSKNVKAQFLLDEGGLVATGMVPFVTPPVAIVFTSEKGYMTLDLSVKGIGGHSSRPPAESPVEILASAINKINTSAFDIRFTESVENFLDYTAPEMHFPFKSLFANRWLFKPIIVSEYKKIPSANAMLRTTVVTTIIEGGNKENVIPSYVHAKINFRLLPGDKSSDILAKVHALINDNRVEVTMQKNTEEASSISSKDSPSFALLSKTIHEVFPDAIVAPNLLIAQTDSRHFRNVTENIYRFLPVRMDDKTLDTMHGNDERIGINDFMESIIFYKKLIQSL